MIKHGDLYRYILSARKEARMTQRELGGRIGVTPQAIGQWEKAVADGGILPPLRRIKQIEDVLHVNFGEIELPDDQQHINMAFIKAPTNYDDLLERRIVLIEKVLHADSATLRLLETIINKS